MIGRFYNSDGDAWQIEQFISFDICHGLGEPCDYYEVSFPYDSSMLKKLSRAYRFVAVHGDETVFRGVVDEYTISISEESGAVVSVSGRSMAALLLDNEAEAAVYGTLTLDTVIANHVKPWGIGTIRKKSMPPLYSFTVESGDSQWSILKRYCRYSCGVQPRFSKEGILILNDESGSYLSLTDDDISLGIKFRDTRYGCISEVLVKNRVTGASYTVENHALKNRGGSARRVINVPRTSGYDSMRYTGEYQITEASRGKRFARIDVPELFAAFPADRITVHSSCLGLDGTFTVSETHCYANENGYGTEICVEV